MARDITTEPSGNILINTGYTVGQLAGGIHYESTATNISGAVGTLDFGGKSVLLHTVTGDLSGSYTFPPTGLPSLTQNATRAILYIEYTQDATGGHEILLDTLFANATSRWGNASVDTAIGGKTRVKIIVKRIGGVLTYHVEFLPVHVHSNLSVDTTHSLTGGGNLGQSRTLSLVNDTASPGNHKYYKTDGSGARGWHALNIDDIDDVTISTPTSNQVLTYNGAVWVNAAPPAGEGGVASEVVDSISALTAIASPTAGQLVNVRGYTTALDGGDGVFIWDATAADWQMLASATVASGGSGYAVNDLLYVEGAAWDPDRAILRVSSVSGTAVTGVTIIFWGKYVTTPGTSGVATTSKNGTGCTLNLSWASHSDYGTRIPRNAGGVGRWMRLVDASGRVSVKAFGATGDNSTNDWQALQRAIWSGERLFIPSGTYLSNKALTWFGLRQLDISGESKEDSRSSRIAANYASEEPLLHKFGRYMKADGSYAFETGYEVSGLNLGGIEDKLVLRNIKFQSDKSIWSSCVDIQTSIQSLFENCLFRASFRGLTLGQSVSDTSVIACDFRSTFMNNFPWSGTTESESNKVIARRAWGLHASGHTSIVGGSAVGCGTGIYLIGAQNVLQSFRIEVNNYGIIIGTKSYNIGQIDQHILSRSSLDGMSFEANTIAIRVEDMKDSSITNFGIQGSPSDGTRPTSEIGVHIQNIYNTATISNGSANGTFTYGALINEGRRSIDRFTASGNIVSYARTNSIFGNTSGQPSYFLYDHRSDTGAITAFSHMRLRGLTGLGIKGGHSTGIARNLGDVVAVSTSATTAAVAFPGEYIRGSYSLGTITTPANGSSTLSAGTYYYATTVLSKTGETGILYGNASSAQHQTVVVASGQAVNFASLGGSGDAKLVRRIYRTKVNAEINNFEGYWEQSNSLSSFVDTGQAFTGRAQPPINGNIMTCEEEDTNYQIVATPSWGTTVHVTNKTTTGFTLNFGTAAPAGGTCAWLLFRP